MSTQPKEKKSKKKTVKSKQTDEEKNIMEFAEVKVEELYINSIINVPEQMDLEYLNSLDVFTNSNQKIKGRKGHTNHYSKQAIETGTFFFEVTVTSADYNFTEYVLSRRTDEFSKKYYENILNNIKAYMPNVRIGVINSTGDLELPIGADEKSYAYRGSSGVIVNDGEYIDGNSPYAQGDTIGVLIHLKPPMPEFLRSTSNQLNECYIKFFKNGKEQPNVFKGLIEGNYHAAVTLYNFSQVEINFGPKFKFANLDDNKSIKSFYEINL